MKAFKGNTENLRLAEKFILKVNNNFILIFIFDSYYYKKFKNLQYSYIFIIRLWIFQITSKECLCGNSKMILMKLYQI